MLVFLAAITAAVATDHPKAGTAAFAAVFTAALAGLVAAARRKDTTPPTHDEQAPLDDLLDPDGTREWTATALAEFLADGDPLTRPLSELDLREPLLFDEIAAAYAVRLDWRPPDFTSEWNTLGTVLDQLGQTQPLPRIEVAAA